MDADAGYALQKLELSVVSLATGAGNIKERLLYIFMEHLHVISDKDIPESLRGEWVVILESVTKAGPKVVDGKVVVGALPNTLRGMRFRTGTKIASNILQLSERLRVELETKSRTP